MKLTVTNKTASRVSTDLGVVEPHQSISMDASPDKAYQASEQLKSLVDNGIIQITSKEESKKIAFDKQNTVSPTVLYVSSTGNNTNPGTYLQPFLTLQAAIDSLPKVICHLTTIKIGPGTFAGCMISGFTVDPIDNSKSCGLDIQGTIVNAVPISGTATGTFTSVVSGNISTAIFSVLNDSTQNWPVNGLRGKFVEILSGQGSGGINMYPIVSNTATSLTIASTILAGSGLGTYGIRDWATTISSPVKIPVAIATYNRPAATATSTALIAIHNNNFSREQLNIQCLKFSPAVSSFYGLHIADTSGLITACNFGDFAVAAISTNGSAASVQMLRCTFITTTQPTAVIIGNSTGSISITNCFALGTVTSKFYITQARNNLAITSCHIEHAFCVSANSATMGCRIDLSGSRLYSTNSACVWIANSSADLWASGPQYILASGLYLSIPTTAPALLVIGPHMVQITNLIVEANTVGIWAHKGAQIQLGPTSSIAAPTEIELDGVSTTLATMRAASPKLVYNGYGTMVYE